MSSTVHSVSMSQAPARIESQATHASSTTPLIVGILSYGALFVGSTGFLTLCAIFLGR